MWPDQYFPGRKGLAPCLLSSPSDFSKPISGTTWPRAVNAAGSFWRWDDTLGPQVQPDLFASVVDRVSAMMIAVNELGGLKEPCSKAALKDLVILLSPYAPHLAEELWNVLGGEEFVIEAVWPKANSQYLVSEKVIYPVSFNGKVRFKLTLPADMPADEVEKIAREDENTLKQMDGREIRKVIVVLGRIINIVG